jgi:16S rRNA (guanine527-N7)-methyltransferase
MRVGRKTAGEGKTERSVVPEQSSRGERGQRKERGSPSEDVSEPDPSSFPRRVSASASAGPHQPLPRSTEGLPPLEPTFWSIVDDGLEQLDVTLSRGARAAIDAQARLLLAWSPFVNLTSLRDAPRMARGHILDSLSAVPLLRRLAHGRVLDLGSGAGYPGLPLAVSLPARECALVDSVGKKQAFLEAAVEAASRALEAHGQEAPGFSPLGERAEGLAATPGQREAWDLTLARAVGALAEVLELCLPLTRPGGHVVAWKRRSADGALEREIDAARPVLHAAGGGSLRVEQPAGLAAAGLPDHVLVVARKVRPTSVRYPRPPSERRRALLT